MSNHPVYEKRKKIKCLSLGCTEDGYSGNPFCRRCYTLIPYKDRTILKRAFKRGKGSQTDFYREALVGCIAVLSPMSREYYYMEKVAAQYIEDKNFTERTVV